MSAEAVLETFDLLAQLAIARDAVPLSKHAGCWECQIGKQWWAAINGQKAAVKCSRGPEVEPYHAYIEFNGWPAGILSPFEGTMAAGAVANEATLCQAIREELER